jgi:replicative DNA helicase
VSERNGHSNRRHRPIPGPVDSWPHNQKAEESVIGAVLLDPESLHEVVQFLRPEMFFRSSLAEAWRSILELYTAAVPIDGISLGDAMKRAGTFEFVGGDLGLAEIMASVPSAANVRHYAEIIRSKWIAREIKVAGNTIVEESISDEYTSAELIDRAESLLFGIIEGAKQDETIKGGVMMSSTIKMVEGRSEGTERIETGVTDLDRMIDGFKPGQLVILAARPSVGKTAFGLHVFANCVGTFREPSLFVSLEMTAAELGERLLMAHADVPTERLRNPDTLNADDIAAIGLAEREWQSMPALINDSPAIGNAGLMSLARRWKARSNLRLMIVDYLQLVVGDGNNRQEEIASISKQLKRIARECKVAVLCLAQLNRNVEMREDKRPRLADLRESGAVEQDADVVLMMHRPDYYRPAENPGYCEVIVAKNRNGPTGSVELRFRKETGRFTPWEEPSFDESAAEF